MALPLVGGDLHETHDEVGVEAVDHRQVGILGEIAVGQRLYQPSLHLSRYLVDAAQERLVELPERSALFGNVVER